MKVLRTLAPLFERQHLTLKGAHKGKWIIAMTDRYVTVIEEHDLKGDPKPMYLDSYVKGSINPANIPATLGKDNLPFYPKGVELITSKEIEKDSGKELMEAAGLLKRIDSLMVGMQCFELPASLHTLKGEWIAVRLGEGMVRVRMSDTFEGLGKSAEHEMGVCDESIEPVEFPLPLELFRMLEKLEPENIAIGVKKTKAVAVSIRIPGALLVIFTKPLNLEEPMNETATDAPSAADLAAGAPGAEENPEAPESSEITVEPTIDGDTETTEPIEPAADDEDAAAQKVIPEDVDPMEALDVLIPEIMRSQAEANKDAFTKMRVLVRNVKKQCRKALKSTADPAEVTELKKKLAVAEKQRDAAKKALKDLL